MLGNTWPPSPYSNSSSTEPGTSPVSVTTELSKTCFSFAPTSSPLRKKCRQQHFTHLFTAAVDEGVNDGYHDTQSKPFDLDRIEEICADEFSLALSNEEKSDITTPLLKLCHLCAVYTEESTGGNYLESMRELGVEKDINASMCTLGLTLSPPSSHISSFFESQELVSLKCSHVFCMTCIGAIIEANSGRKSLLTGALTCPFRCEEGAALGTAGRKVQSIINQQKKYCKGLYRAAYIEAMNVEGGNKAKYTPNRFDTIFQYKFNDLMGIKNSKRLDRIQSQIFSTTEEVIRSRHFNTCTQCFCVFVGGAVNCSDGLEDDPSSSQQSAKCFKCTTQVYCRKHKAEFIEWKCMFCCRREPAAWVCGEDTHLCSDCHSNKSRGVRMVCDTQNCVFSGRHPKGMTVGTRHAKMSLGCAACR